MVSRVTPHLVSTPCEVFDGEHANANQAVLVFRQATFPETCPTREKKKLQMDSIRLSSPQHISKVLMVLLVKGDFLLGCQEIHGA